jgi:hydrogenase expression/formation protein HypC
MCLGVPGQIKAIYQQGSLAMGKIDFGGVSKEACLAYVPEAQVGDYVLVHVGFAISLMDEDEAMETLKTIRELATFSEALDAAERGA